MKKEYIIFFSINSKPRIKDIFTFISQNKYSVAQSQHIHLSVDVFTYTTFPSDLSWEMSHLSAKYTLSFRFKNVSFIIRNGICHGRTDIVRVKKKSENVGLNLRYYS